MRSARCSVELKAGVRRLSGGEAKDMRYVEGAGVVTVMEPPETVAPVEVRAGGMGREKRRGTGAMLLVGLVRRVVECGGEVWGWDEAGVYR